jgi:hypothetical protein
MHDKVMILKQITSFSDYRKVKIFGENGNRLK